MSKGNLVKKIKNSFKEFQSFDCSQTLTERGKKGKNQRGKGREREKRGRERMRESELEKESECLPTACEPAMRNGCSRRTMDDTSSDNELADHSHRYFVLPLLFSSLFSLSFFLLFSLLRLALFMLEVFLSILFFR